MKIAILISALYKFIIIIAIQVYSSKAAVSIWSCMKAGGGMRILINNKVVRLLTEGSHFIALCK